MKKVLVIVLAVAVFAAAILGTGAWLSYRAIGPENVPDVVVTVNGTRLAPYSYQWSEPVLGGLTTKSFTDYSTAAPVDAGETAAGSLPFSFPEGYDVSLALSMEGTDLFSGSLNEWDATSLSVPGTYSLEITCATPADGDTGGGRFSFQTTFTVVPAPIEEVPEPTSAFHLPAEPTFQAGETRLQQGDVFAMQLLCLPDGVTPTAQTDLGMAVFTPLGAGCWFAAVPVGNVRQPGEYSVAVAAGEERWTATVTVLPFAFDEQDLIIDVTDPVISEANSAAAYQQYREKIPPLFNTWDDEKYWEGPFLQPAEGRISTTFGSIRYTNGDYANPSHHWGMDIAAAEGTPIQAPAAGRVVLAEYLLNTGWTIAIEHGGGLKSYYFHMNEIHVEADAMVEQGQRIGAIGTTGYSTGPHLHFETRIGNQAISPHMLFEEGAGLYSLDLYRESDAA